jgi:PHD/YefM family antitoxin component YafN of YafNO toxin-antitoxin module
MIDVTKTTHTLAEFKENAEELLKQIKESGQPLVLNVNRKKAAVVLDAAAFQRMLEHIDRLEAMEGIRKGLDAFARGDHLPAKQALEAIRHDVAVASSAILDG